jgi:hypothetical protein
VESWRVGAEDVRGPCLTGTALGNTLKIFRPSPQNNTLGPGPNTTTQPAVHITSHVGFAHVFCFDSEVRRLLQTSIVIPPAANLHNGIKDTNGRPSSLCAHATMGEGKT